MPSIYRSGVLLSGEEFANVAGRAGRAFVDVEGLVVHVMYEPTSWRVRAWRELVNSARARTLESGLIQLVAQIICRLAETGVLKREDAVEYLANSREAWQDAGEGDGEENLVSLLERLDAAVLGLVEALDADADDLPRLLDEVLQGSLWARQIARRSENAQRAFRAILIARARVLWRNTTQGQRRGLYAMGVGLDAGLSLEAIADQLSALLEAADSAAIAGDEDELIRSLTALGRQLFHIRPFVPDDLPGNWCCAAIRMRGSVNLDEKVSPDA